MTGRSQVWGGAERRQYPRLRKQIRVRYMLTGQVKTAHGMGAAVDISAGGMQLCITDASSSNARGILKGSIRDMELWFRLPSESESVNTMGEVRWTKADGTDKVYVGIKFVGMGDEDMGKILRYVVSRFIDDRL